jgi:hypothetical protein
MAKTFQIINNTICSINEDGSVSRLGTISSQGTIEVEGASKGKTKSSYTWISVVIIFIIGAIAMNLWNKNVKLENDLSSQVGQNKSMNIRLQKSNEKISSLESEISSLEKSLESMQSSLKVVGNTFPLIITDIEIANTKPGGEVITDYGQNIYSHQTMYLMPRVSYYGLSAGRKELKVKWIKPDGTLRTGTSSPYGYSYSDNINCLIGSNHALFLSSWGNNIVGNWNPGTHRIEIWYNNTCLKSKSFTIY